jgi:hypothetical protein
VALSRCPVTPVSTIPNNGTEMLERIIGKAMRQTSRLPGMVCESLRKR